MVKLPPAEEGRFAMRYLISYERSTPGQDLQPLRDALEALGAGRILKSQWIVQHNGTTCQDLLNRLVRVAGANDRLLVTELDGSGVAGYNLLTDLGAAWYLEAV